MPFLYILGTILFTVYGQMVMRWRIPRNDLPDDLFGKVGVLLQYLLDPFILSGLVSAFIASLFWMAAMTKFELSFAYPFMSLTFVLVLICSSIFFKETLTMQKIIGAAFVIAGLIIVSRS
jgi:drug/metabolite transporter (DMT)-like permease